MVGTIGIDDIIVSPPVEKDAGAAEDTEQRTLAGTPDATDNADADTLVAANELSTAAEAPAGREAEPDGGSKDGEDG
jgi:hypothetical protein